MAISKLAQLAIDNRDAANWYDAAAAEIAEVCDIAGWDSELFTAVLAITSPRVSVCRNARLTLQYMSTGDLFANAMGNIRVSLLHYLATNEIRGPKTGPFFHALRGDTTAIVLDTHMASLLQVSQASFARQGIRKKCCRAIRGAARLADLTPRDCQAALWTGYLRGVGRNPSRLNIAREYANMRAYGGQFPHTGPIAQLVDGCGRYQPTLF